MVLIRVAPQSVAASAERLAKLSHVRFVGVTMGSSDIVIQTLHTSFDEMFRFVSEELPDLVPGVLSTETLQVARVLKSDWNWAEWVREGLVVPTARGRDAGGDAAT
jgi:Lrp/AsnC family transcriptional regulator for asnA, asnC and gidA